MRPQDITWDGQPAFAKVLPVETGRLLFCPSLHLLTTPMTEFCVLAPFEIGSYRIQAELSPPSPSRRIVRVTMVKRSCPPSGRLSGYVNLHAPYLFVGDMAYAGSLLTEGSQRAALTACPKAGTVASVRIRTGEVACCVRFGQFPADVGVRWAEGRGLEAIIAERLPDPEDSD